MDYLKTLQSFLYDFEMNLLPNLTSIFPNSPSVKSNFYVNTR